MGGDGRIASLIVLAIAEWRKMAAPRKVGSLKILPASFSIFSSKIIGQLGQSLC